MFAGCPKTSNLKRNRCWPNGAVLLPSVPPPEGCELTATMLWQNGTDQASSVPLDLSQVLHQATALQPILVPAAGGPAGAWLATLA